MRTSEAKSPDARLGGVPQGASIETHASFEAAAVPYCSGLGCLEGARFSTSGSPLPMC